LKSKANSFVLSFKLVIKGLTMSANNKHNTTRKNRERESNPIKNYQFDKTQKALLDYNHCYLCGRELLFVHVTDYVTNSVKEEAHCEHCGIKTKTQKHHLQ
jgi:DNA-directed RNA polymerase subunit RPC12/RpoP